MEQPEIEPDIDDIIDSFSERLERGEFPSIKEYTDKYPQLATQIAAALPALVVLNRVDQKPDRKLAFDDSIPEIIGDYQIIQEVGRGGMGIVFEAQHLTMRRRVALKVLPKSSAEKPNYLSRFMTEARSAGQLHHTNIVPVFEVGEAEGLHFYTMQFISGDNLDRVIEDVKRLRGISSPSTHASVKRKSTLSLSLAKNLLSTVPFESEEGTIAGELLKTAENKSLKTQQPIPQKPTQDTPSLIDKGNSSTDELTGSRTSYYRRVAQIGSQIADALAHAHHHGVLHRDVKPGNLILDSDGVAWITDFGLAKAGTDGLTLTGDIIGTLRYMAPERFHGKGDRRSDIFSLGLTLYELCALQSAFVNDRGQLVADVQSRAIRPIREIDESIPFDLETIISKAIEHQPESRYQHAHEMADDLNRFVHDRPIKARRVSMLERIYRICRRNPVAASLTGCVFALIALLIAGTLQFAFYKAEQTQNEINLRKRLQTNLYNAKLDQTQMRLLSRREGQRTQSLKAVREANDLLASLEDAHPDFVEQEKAKLRSEAIAALSLTDIEESWATEFPSGTGSRFRCAIDHAAQRYVVGHDSGQLDIRRVSDGKKILTLHEADAPNWLVEFDKTGRYLASIHHQPGASIHRRVLHVWDLNNTEKPLLTRKVVRYSAFSDDGSKIAISHNDHVEIFSLLDGKTIGEFSPQFNDPGDPVDRTGLAKPKMLKFSNSGPRIAVAEATGDRVEIWNFENEPKYERSFACDSYAMCFDWDDRRKLLAMGTDQGTLLYWRYEESDEPTTIALHQNAIVRMFLHPTKQLVVTYAWDQTNRITDLVAQRELLCVYEGVLLRSGFCQDGRLGFVQENEKMGLWQLSAPVIKQFSVAGRFGSISVFHPIDSGIVARIVNDFVEFWDLRSESLVEQIKTSARSVEFTPDGTQILISNKSGITKRDFLLRRQDQRCSIELGKPTVLTQQDSNRILIPMQSEFAGSFFSTHGRVVMRRSLEDGQVLTRFDPLRGLSEISLTADGEFLLAGTWHGLGVRLWDAKTGKETRTILEDEVSATVCADPSNPKRFATYGSVYRIWEFDSQGVPQLVHKGSSKSVRGSYESGGARMTSQVDPYHISYVDPKQNKTIATLKTLGPSRVIYTKFSPDSKSIALACFDNLQIIDLEELRNELKSLDLDW